MSARIVDDRVAGSLRSRFRESHLDWIVPDWPAPRSVQAFFTTRNGGVSVGACASMDLGSSDGSVVSPEFREAIAENRRSIRSFLPSPPVWLDQVHGTEVVDVDALARRAGSDAPPRADAAVTRATDVVLAIRVADCLPVLFSDRAGSVIGLAHAGWRGLSAGVLENTVAAMAGDPARLIAWLGPAIGAAAFEVGPDVRDAFVASDDGAGSAFVPGRPGKWYGDLRALARRRLARIGIVDVTADASCTLSEPSRFFSFRRDGTPGRMAAFVWRTAA